MGEIVDIRSLTGDHVAFARWPHGPSQLLPQLLHDGRIYAYVGRIRGIATYDEIHEGTVWIVPPELYSNDTPIVTSRVSESEILAYDEDLPDTIEPPPPSSQSRKR
jgi:hypothetical protein